MCHIIASQRLFLAGSAAHGHTGAVLFVFTDKIILVELFGRKALLNTLECRDWLIPRHGRPQHFAVTLKPF